MSEPITRAKETGGAVEVELEEKKSLGVIAVEKYRSARSAALLASVDDLLKGWWLFWERK
jgi:hypothetical protein